MDDYTPEPGAPGPESSSGPAGTGSDEAPKKSTSPWVWVAIGAAVVLVLGAVYASSTDSGSLLFLFGGQEVTVPLVVGQAQADAESAIIAAGLRVGQVSEEPTLAVAPGIVVAQSPAAESNVEEDSAVDIVVSAIPRATVPDVTGQTLSAASATLAEEGILVGVTTYVFDSSVKAGYVISQDPQAGADVMIGSAVALTVSKGVETGQVPNVVGLSQGDAESTLTGAGFKVTVTKATNADVPAGDVISQAPAAGTVVTAGSTVTITVSTGAPAAPAAPTTPTQPSTPTTPEEPSAPEPETVTVPDVVGMGALEAVRALKDANLKFSIEFGTSTENFLKVAAQDPKAGTEVEPGTSVTITIGLPSFSFERPSVEPTTLPAPEPEQPTESDQGAESTTSP